MNNQPPCPDWADKLALRQEDLSPSDRMALDMHLEKCSVCSAARTDYTMLIAQLQAAIKPLPGFTTLPALLEEEAHTYEKSREFASASNFLRTKHGAKLLARERSRHSTNQSWVALIVLSIIFATLVIFQRSHIFTLSIIKALSDYFVDPSHFYAIVASIAALVSAAIMIITIMRHRGKETGHLRNFIATVAVIILIVLAATLKIMVSLPGIDSTTTGGIPPAVLQNPSTLSTTPTPRPTPTPNPTPSLTPPAASKELIIHDETINYYQLILHGLYSGAYAMLSSEQQAQLSLLQFEANPNYSLSSQVCWRNNGVTSVTQLDNITWDDDVKLAQVSCTDGTPIAHFDWSFRWQMQQGRLVITSIGLYPLVPG